MYESAEEYYNPNATLACSDEIGSECIDGQSGANCCCLLPPYGHYYVSRLSCDENQQDGSYDNPYCKDIQEFFEDIKRLHYIRRLFKRYDEGKVLKERLIINHLITFYNVFENKAATRILFYKVEKEFHPILKTFLVYLNRMPFEKYTEIGLDENIIDKLRGME